MTPLKNRIVHTNKTVIILTAIIYYSFFPLFWIIKTFRKTSFEKKKAKAIQEAIKLNNKKQQAVHVIQHGSEFFVGTKDDCKRLNRTNKKSLRKYKYSFDYRRAIIYTAK